MFFNVGLLWFHLYLVIKPGYVHTYDVALWESLSIKAIHAYYKIYSLKFVLYWCVTLSSDIISIGAL